MSNNIRLHKKKKKNNPKRRQRTKPASEYSTAQATAISPRSSDTQPTGTSQPAVDVPSLSEKKKKKSKKRKSKAPVIAVGVPSFYGDEEEDDTEFVVKKNKPKKQKKQKKKKKRRQHGMIGMAASSNTHHDDLLTSNMTSVASSSSGIHGLTNNGSQSAGAYSKEHIEKMKNDHSKNQVTDTSAQANDGSRTMTMDHDQIILTGDMADSATISAQQQAIDLSGQDDPNELQDFVDQTVTQNPNDDIDFSAYGNLSAKQMEYLRKKMKRDRDSQMDYNSYIPLDDERSTQQFGFSSSSHPLDRVNHDASFNNYVRQDTEDHNTVSTFPGDNRVAFGDPGKRQFNAIPSDVHHSEMPSVHVGDGNTKVDKKVQEVLEGLHEHEIDLMRRSGTAIPENLIQSMKQTQIEPEPQTFTPKLPKGWNKMVEGRFDINTARYKLKDALANANRVRETAKQNLETAERNLEIMQQQQEKVVKKKNSLGEQYTFFQELELEAGEIVSCLREKKQDIDTAHNNLIEEFKHKDKSTRAFIIANTLEDFRQSFQEREPRSKVLTEADLQARKKRMLKREKKIERHWKFAEEKRKSLDGKFSPELLPGWNTDEDSDIEETFQRNRKALVTDFNLIFRDAREDMQNFDSIQEKFEKCRKEHPKAYLNAFISQSFRALAEPYVELSTLQWDPLNSPELSSMHWFKQMKKFTKDVKDDKDSDDVSEDGRLIPMLTEKTVIPILTESVTYLWNPYSDVQTENLVNIIEEVCNLCLHPEESKNVEQLILSALNRIDETIASHLRPQKAFPAIPSVPKSGNPHKADWKFCSRLWWKAMKFLVNLLKWSKVVDDKRIRDISFQHIETNILPFLKYLLTLPTSSARGVESPQLLAIFNMIDFFFTTLPSEWFDDGHKHLRTISELLNRYHLMALPFARIKRNDEEMDRLEKLKMLSRRMSN